MSRPRSGPKAGSTVESVVMMTPQIVIDWPHHLVSGAATGGLAGLSCIEHGCGISY